MAISCTIIRIENFREAHEVHSEKIIYLYKGEKYG